MNRAELLEALVVRYGNILEEAGISPDADGLAPALDETDAALAATGASRADWAEPFARFYLLDRIVDALLNQVNYSDPTVNTTLNQLITNTERRLKEARAAVAWYVVPSPPTDTTIPVADGSYENAGRVIRWRGGR